MELAPGRYHGQILGIGFAETAKGTPYVFVEVMVTSIHAPEDGQWYEIEQEKRDINFYASEKAMEMTREKLAKLGFNNDFNNPAFAEKYYTEGVYLTCKHRTSDQGRTFEEWEFEDLSWERKTLDKASLQALAAKFKAGAPAQPAKAPAKPGTPKNNMPPAAGKGGTQPAPAAPSPQAVGVGPTKDIPF